MKIKRSKNAMLVHLIVFAIVLFGCIQTFAVAHHYAVPLATNDGWKCDSLGSVNLDTNLIEQLSERVRDNNYKNIHSVVVAKDGRLVLEEYFSGENSSGHLQTFTQDTLNEIKSATKSVNSLLVGIAIGRHLIRGVDEKVSTFFPKYSDIFTNKEKASLGLVFYVFIPAVRKLDIPRDVFQRIVATNFVIHCRPSHCLCRLHDWWF